MVGVWLTSDPYCLERDRKQKSPERNSQMKTYTMTTQRNSFRGAIRRRLLRATRPTVLFELLHAVPYHSRVRGEAPHREQGLNINAYRLSRGQSDFEWRSAAQATGWGLVAISTHTTAGKTRVYLEYTGTSVRGQGRQRSAPPPK